MVAPGRQGGRSEALSGQQGEPGAASRVGWGSVSRVSVGILAPTYPAPPSRGKSHTHEKFREDNLFIVEIDPTERTGCSKKQTRRTAWPQGTAVPAEWLVEPWNLEVRA